MILIGVINESGDCIGLFPEAPYAEAFIMGICAEQMRMVGYVKEYATVPIDVNNLPRIWPELVKEE